MKTPNESHFADPIYRSAFCGARSKIGLSVVNGVDAESIATDVVILFLQIQKEAAQHETGERNDLPFYKSTSWAYCVGQRKAINALRKHQVIKDNTSFLSKNIEDSNNCPERFAVMTEEQRKVQQVLLSLRFQDAVYLFCRYWMGFSNKEVAKFWAELTGKRFSERTHLIRFEIAKIRLRMKLKQSAF